MINKKMTSAFLFTLLFVLNSAAQNDHFPILKGPCLGQKSAGMTPEIFAPGILSRFIILHGKLVFSPDGLETFWTCNAAPAQSRWTARQTSKGVWSAPEPSFFSIGYVENSMAYRADGAHLFFCGGDPTDKGYTNSRCYRVDTKSIESLRPSVGMLRQQLEINQEELDSNELQPPDKVMDAAGIRAGMIIGEVGSGKGRYTVYLADRVGPEGKVYANDIDVKSLAFLKNRCQKQGFANIEIILGTTDDPCFPQGQLDMVFMTWVYHHLEHPVALLRNLIPSLKPGGTVVIVDPDPVKNRGGKSPENRSPEQIRREAGEAGFEVVRIDTFLKLDNIYILRTRG